MKDLRDLKDLTIHDVQPISDEEIFGPFWAERPLPYLYGPPYVPTVLPMGCPLPGY